MKDARNKGREETTTLWAWNIQRARVSFPKRNRFAEIVKAIANSKAEVVMMSELQEQEEGFKWIKAREIFGVLIHGKRNGFFLRDQWASKWADQGYRRVIRERSISIDVDGYRFISTYQPLWEGLSIEFMRYREELSTLIESKDMVIIGGDFNSVVGESATRGRTRRRVSTV